MLLLAAAALLFAAPLQAGRVRLVLDNGYVLPLNADGSAFAGEFGRLALPGEQRIHAIEPDYATGRLYVTLDGPQPGYLTQVHDLASLKLLDTLDGVVTVYVPDAAKARTVLMRRYAPRKDTGYAGSVLSLLSMLGGDVQWQRRDRRRYATVLAERRDEGERLLPRCDLGGSRPYLSIDPYRRFDRHFAPVQLPGLQADRERNRSRGQQRSVAACLDDGQTLELLSDQTPRSTDPETVYAVRALERRRGERVLARYAPDSAVLPSTARDEARWLGRDGRYVALLDLDLVLDLADGTLTGAHVAGPPWLTRSADGETLYGLPRHYVYRSIVSSGYIEGGWPVFTGGVDRLSVAGGHVRRDKLPLPAELQDLLAQQDAQSEAFRERLEQSDPSEAAAAEENDAREAGESEPETAAPVLTPLQRQLGPWITIIGVLDD